MPSPFAVVLESVLDQAQTLAVLDIFVQIGVAAWLEKHPIRRLGFQTQIVYQGRVLQGVYSYKDNTMEIAVTRAASSYGQTLEWGKTDKVSNTALTLHQAMQFTLLHELGHHLHAALLEYDRFEFAMTLRAVRTNAVSNYAKTPLEPIEYFAETFVAWVLYRTELLIYDNLGYGMIQRALKILALELEEI